MLFRSRYGPALFFETCRQRAPHGTAENHAHSGCDRPRRRPRRSPRSSAHRPPTGTPPPYRAARAPPARLPCRTVPWQNLAHGPIPPPNQAAGAAPSFAPCAHTPPRRAVDKALSTWLRPHVKFDFHPQSKGNYFEKMILLFSIFYVLTRWFNLSCFEIYMGPCSNSEFLAR